MNDEPQDDSGKINAVSGLVYRHDFILPSYEAELIASIDQQHNAWMTDLSRRVQHYGYRYHYERPHVHITEKDYLGPLPEWLRSLADRLTGDGLIVKSPDQAIINEYLPGQGISKHIDCDICFCKGDRDCIFGLYVRNGLALEANVVSTIAAAPQRLSPHWRIQREMDP